MNSEEKNKSNPGESFRVAREKSGLSLSDVALATKISPRILRALEEGDRSELPAHSFARGFIRSYAAYLKIESQSILEAFDLSDGLAGPHINTDSNRPNETIKLKTEPSSPNSHTQSAALPNKEAEKKKAIVFFADASLASKGLLIVALLIGVAIVFGVKKVVDKYAQERIVEPQETLLPAPEEASTPPNIEIDEDKGSSVDRTAEASSGANPVTSEEADAIVQTDKISVTQAESAPVPSQPKPQPAPETPKVEISVPAVASNPTPTKVSTVPQEVIIEALDNVEFTVRVDGGSQQKISLKPESIHTVKAKSEIQLEIRDGGTINIVHNGRDRGVPGDLGKPIKLKYP